MIAKYLSLAAAGMLVSSVALAQNTAPASTNNATTAGDTTAGATDAAASASKTESLRQQMKATLQQAGFTNVRVMPDSFLVQAKDKSGHPVAMIINPNSMTEIVDEGALGQASAQNAGTGTGAEASASADTNGRSGSTFTQVPTQEKLSSNVVGVPVYNKQNQDVGTIKDIAYGQHGVKAYIIGVGGFLGMGDHYVALQPTAVNFTYDHADKQWRADIDATAQQLKQAPAYNYPNQG